MIELIARLAREFRADHNASHQLVRIKNDNLRDVVTELDLSMHSIGKEFADGAGFQFLSEESTHEDAASFALSDQKIFVFDPIDGSNNLLLDLDAVSSLGAFFNDRVIESSFLILLREGAYFSWEKNEFFSSRDISRRAPIESAPYYLAFPPFNATSLGDRELISKLFWGANSLSAGVYREGSAGVGIAHCLTMQHSGFLGVKLRIWDVVAGLPMLAASGFRVGYKIEGTSISVLASWDEYHYSSFEQIFAANGVILNSYSTGSSLEV